MMARAIGGKRYGRNQQEADVLGRGESDFGVGLRLVTKVPITRWNLEAGYLDMGSGLSTSHSSVSHGLASGLAL